MVLECLFGAVVAALVVVGTGAPCLRRTCVVFGALGGSLDFSFVGDKRRLRLGDGWRRIVLAFAQQAVAAHNVDVWIPRMDRSFRRDRVRASTVDLLGVVVKK